MDDIYKDLNREERIEMIYDLTLQNVNGRESVLEMYKLGIEACYDEMCVGKETKNEESNCNIPDVVWRSEQLTAFLLWYWREVDGKPCDINARDVVDSYGG